MVGLRQTTLESPRCKEADATMPRCYQVGNRSFDSSIGILTMDAISVSSGGQFDTDTAHRFPPMWVICVFL